MAKKDLIFDNQKVEDLIEQYNQNGRDPLVLGEIFVNSRTLISVIASKYSQGDLEQDDLEQEAKAKLMQVIHKYSPDKGKAYSYFSVVIMHAMVDYVRKFNTNILVDEVEQETAIDTNEDDVEFIIMVVEGLYDWFTVRFPTLVSSYIAMEVLESIIMDMMDETCTKRSAINHLMDDFEFIYKEAKVLYEATTVKLRLLSDQSVYTSDFAPEATLLPELLEMVGSDNYVNAYNALTGLAIRFKEN